VPGAVVRGWVGSEEGSPPRFIVITDASGIIRGLASGSTHEVRRKDNLEAIPWHGYIARFDSSQRYEAYGVLSDEQVCRVVEPLTRVRLMKTRR
jgi:hypothetical protein